MAKSQLTFKKKEHAKKKSLKKQDKLERRANNKLNNDKGKTLEELFAYVDEYGNLSSSPPVNPYKFKKEDLERPEIKEDEYSFGKVSYYNESGRYGFIRDNETKETIYFNDLLAGKVLLIDQKVQFKFVRTKKGNQVSEVVVI